MSYNDHIIDELQRLDAKRGPLLDKLEDEHLTYEEYKKYSAQLDEIEESDEYLRSQFQKEI